jgi:RNA polymerase sigma-70 factor (ECF subfamily)
MQTPDADSFLVAAIRKGDQRAWRQLIERYQGRLLAFARSRLGAGAEAEDALQETLLGFVNSLRHYDEERSLETYLFAILRYKIRESLERRRHTPEVGFGFDVDDDAPGRPDPVDGETPSTIAARRELTRQAAGVLADVLRRLIEELRDRDKLDDLQVVELLFFVGLRNKEAAERLGRDEKAVAGVKFRAIARLRDFLVEAVAGGRFDPATLPLEDLLTDDATISQVWRRRRLSCLKRSTLGSFLLGALDEPWESYTRFHLDTIGCLMCRANRDDLAGPEGEARPGLGAELFASSVGFLSRLPDTESQP